MKEILGAVVGSVLALLGVGTVGGLVYFWYTSDRVANTFTAMTQARNELWASYRFQPGRYGSGEIPNYVLLRMKAMPESEVSGSTLVNAWGGNWAFEGQDATLWAGIDQVPRSDCMRMVTRFPSSTGIQQVRIGTSLAGLGTAMAAPVEPGIASGTCADGVNAISFGMSATN